MSAGTLTLTNNSAAVMGSGTAFTTELAAGDFAVVTVGGIPYTLPVKTVNSNTSLTLVSNFTGPTQSGAAWSAIPRIAMNLVTAAVVAQAAEALRGLNYDKQNWQQVFSSPGMITVRLPDGSSFPGPSWKYMSDNMATKENGAVPINQGGTGANTVAGARTKLGLGTAALIDANTGVAGVSGWFRDTATGWITQKGRVTVAANTSVAVTLPISFTTVGTCIVVCTINSSGASFSSTGDLLGTMDSAGVVRISNTHSVSLSINYIIIGW